MLSYRCILQIFKSVQLLNYTTKQTTFELWLYFLNIPNPEKNMVFNTTYR